MAKSKMNAERPTDKAEGFAPRGIFLLPNLLTTSALFSGFYSMVASTQGYYEAAAIAIFIAMVADGLDGRVARLTNTQTPFGAQYDSLSDMAAFGIAPALLIYNWSLAQLGKLGWLAAFLYVAACALRLARFNTQVVDDKRYFQGLPSPAAAALLTSIAWSGTSLQIPGVSVAGPTAIMTAVIASLMVSMIRFNSFKSVDLKGRVSFVTIVFVVFLLTAIAMNPPLMFFCIFFSYLVSGPILTLIQLRRMQKMRHR